MKKEELLNLVYNLIDQIEINNFKDGHDHDLRNNKSYRELVEAIAEEPKIINR